LSDANASLTQNRLVVFEAFMRSTCGNCIVTGPVIDQLAQEYSGQPVVFLEYDVDNAPYSRKDCWWQAYSGSSALLPLVMVDSGNQISNGSADFYNVSKAMVNAALARPAQAEIQAYWWRTGNKVEFAVQVKNISTVTLSWDNSATVHAIVYEDARVGVTNRFVRAAISTYISNLAPNVTATFTLEISELSNVNWDNLHFIVLADYLPSGWVGAYDMLQAAVALPITAPFTAQPDSLTFMVDPSDSFIPQALVNFQGPDFENWTAIPSAPWLTITPSSGSITTQPTISVIENNLSTGWQQGNITFTTTDGFFSDQVIVNAYLGSVKRVYLPIVVR
jgi:thiol-disulfide isomerase/thioredoxin